MRLTCDCVDAVPVDTWAYTFYATAKIVSTRTGENDKEKRTPSTS